MGLQGDIRRPTLRNCGRLYSFSLLAAPQAFELEMMKGGDGGKREGHGKFARLLNATRREPSGKAEASACWSVVRRRA